MKLIMPRETQGRTAKEKLAAKESSVEKEVDQCIRRRLADCHYGFALGKVTWRYENRTLILRGRVSSFYLKQVLQQLLKDIEQVGQVVNDVDVISSTGLSSVRSK